MNRPRDLTGDELADRAAELSAIDDPDRTPAQRSELMAINFETDRRDVQADVPDPDNLTPKERLRAELVDLGGDPDGLTVKELRDAIEDASAGDDG